MFKLILKSRQILSQNDGMELLQVALLVAIAIIIGLFFKDQITTFVGNIFDGLSSDDYDSESML
ncbi:MAG: hypothetical protein LBN35_04825 [Clostridiales Family XIII bacterium]|jgi:hypothetical protein|nr:hypothetical protein [Clostridiales Family XIII bacterium]